MHKSHSDVEQRNEGRKGKHVLDAALLDSFTVEGAPSEVPVPELDVFSGGFLDLLLPALESFLLGRAEETATVFVCGFGELELGLRVLQRGQQYYLCDRV